MQELCDSRFFLSYCLRFEKLIISSKAAIEILEKLFECLKTRYSILEPRSSMLDSFEHQGSTVNLHLHGTVSIVRLDLGNETQKKLKSPLLNHPSESKSLGAYTWK